MRKIHFLFVLTVLLSVPKPILGPNESGRIYPVFVANVQNV